MVFDSGVEQLVGAQPQHSEHFRGDVLTASRRVLSDDRVQDPQSAQGAVRQFCRKRSITPANVSLTQEGRQGQVSVRTIALHAQCDFECDFSRRIAN